MKEGDAPHTAHTPPRIPSPRSDGERSPRAFPKGTLHHASVPIANGRSPRPDVLPLRAQLLAFREALPLGFSSAAWQSRRWHRHELHTVAKVLLNPRRLAHAIVHERGTELIEKLTSLLERAELISQEAIEQLGQRHTHVDTALVVALYSVLHGEEAGLAHRFDRWTRTLENALGRRPSWALATAPLAIARPAHHICVCEAAFARLARWMSPRLSKGCRVSGEGYERWLAMAQRIARTLDDEGLPPSDLFDIHDLIQAATSDEAVRRSKELLALAFCHSLARRIDG